MVQSLSNGGDGVRLILSERGEALAVRDAEKTERSPHLQGGCGLSRYKLVIVIIIA
ncbi:hypothetical protein J2W97_000530 [Paenibacillus jamilae]|uniref:hypothetical protein n=1 Tax=Paenibacillus polymyxa TaxID=1406 RepID=UPI001580F855|nr:hypothetical protein [Paenibacillus polymyxa]MDP9674547.1 hypothetical protein [Paenibacillus jamilae]